MIHLKDGVKLSGIKAELALAIMVAETVFRKEGHKFTITSLTEGKHIPNSLHYVGLAFDVRTWADDYGTQLSAPIKEHLAQKLREALGEEFDVLVRPTHIHVELDA